jgi:ATP-dependent RNA helicase DeaD
LGKITLADRHALVDVPESLVERVLKALQKTTIRGQRVEVRRDKPRR